MRELAEPVGEWLTENEWLAQTQLDEGHLLGGITVKGNDRCLAAEVTLPRTAMRWVSGYTGKQHGLWDRRHPERPVLLWPPQDRWAASMSVREAERRNVDPVVAAATLPGMRAWAAAGASLTSMFRDSDPAHLGLLLHWHPAGHHSITPVLSEGLGYALKSRPGFEYADLLDQSMRWSTVNRPTFRVDLWKPAVLADTWDDVQLVARARVNRRFRVGAWQPVPDDVPRGLLATADWVRHAASASPLRD
jgi:hypothetical protein